MAPCARLIAREDVVLVIIDMQERLAAAMSKRDAVTLAASRLARTAALIGAPTIITRQYPQGLGETVSELRRVLEHLEHEGARVARVDKTAFCCADEVGFMEALQATGRRQVVLAGMETHICVGQTALALAAEDFEVHVAADASCSREDSAHEIALHRMRFAGVTVTTSESVMYEALGRAGTDEFRRLLAIVKE